MTNERPTEHLILSGDYFADSVDNIVEIIGREQIEDSEQKLTYIKRVTEIFDYDTSQIATLPAISVSWEGFEEKVRTIGQKRTVGTTITNIIAIWYYHEEVQEEIRAKEIRSALWELDRILRRNSDVNGLSAEGATIEDGQAMQRLRGDTPYSGGLINMRVPVNIRSRRGVS